MRKIRFGFGGVLMLLAMFISDSVLVFFVYFVAAVLHELGHILAAKLMKFDIKEIRFEFSGVRICTDTSLTSYKKEIILAAAGPVVNILVFVISVFIWCIDYGAEEELFLAANRFLSLGNGNFEEGFAFFALSSFVQALGNLLPVESFDGGRILYCAIAEIRSEKIAQRVLEMSSALSAFILWTVALYLMLKVSSGLGMYVFAACIFLCTCKNIN